LVGGWIVGSLILGAVATQNFRMIDRLLSAPSPELSSAIAPVGQDESRTILRHVASELNRHYFRAWGFIQLAFGVVLVVGALGLKPIDRAGAIGAMAVVALVVALMILNWLLVPLGRGLDFVPRTPAPPALARFSKLHLFYTSLDALKLLLCGWLLIRWSRRASRIPLKR
ncbi:MAG: hypothetical protein ACREJ4_15325, partial [Candidatus Methylomirabilaceae bacterium]